MRTTLILATVGVLALVLAACSSTLQPAAAPGSRAVLPVTATPPPPPVIDPKDPVLQAGYLQLTARAVQEQQAQLDAQFAAATAAAERTAAALAAEQTRVSLNTTQDAAVFLATQRAAVATSTANANATAAALDSQRAADGATATAAALALVVARDRDAYNAERANAQRADLNANALPGVLLLLGLAIGGPMLYLAYTHARERLDIAAERARAVALREHVATGQAGELVIIDADDYGRIQAHVLQSGAPETKALPAGDRADPDAVAMSGVPQVHTLQPLRIRDKNGTHYVSRIGDEDTEEGKIRAGVLAFLRSCWAAPGFGARSMTLPTAAVLGMSDETRSRQVGWLKSAGCVTTRMGKGGGTFIAGQFGDLRGLYRAIERGTVAFTSPGPAPNAGPDPEPEPAAAPAGPAAAVRQSVPVGVPGSTIAFNATMPSMPGVVSDAVAEYEAFAQQLALIHPSKRAPEDTARLRQLRAAADRARAGASG